MAQTTINYLRLLQSLLPRGRAWNRNDESDLTGFLYGQAEEFARVDNRSSDLLQERDVRLASELLIDHEIDLGLPDSCSPENETIQERRLAAHGRLIALGQQNPAYFIELAAAYGWTIAITEYSAFICGEHEAGDECGDSENFFYWKVAVTVSGGNIIYFTCGSSECGDLLAFLNGVDSTICALNKYKPAHTTILWEFNGPGFDRGFDIGFDSIPSSSEGYLTGSFSQGFDSGFDVAHGGGFETDGFDSGFNQPN